MNSYLISDILVMIKRNLTPVMRLPQLIVFSTIQPVMFIWVFPLVFASSIFVPVETMSKGVRIFAEHNPVSYTANTVRALTMGTPVGTDIYYAFAWIIGIMVVFIPLAVNRYRKIN